MLDSFLKRIVFNRVYHELSIILVHADVDDDKGVFGIYSFDLFTTILYF